MKSTTTLSVCVSTIIAVDNLSDDMKVVIVTATVVGESENSQRLKR